jgi:hypothetical protein
MATPLKVGGYVYRRRLNRAKRMNKRVREIVGTIIRERPGNGYLYQLLAELAQCESTELEALIELERIIEQGSEDSTTDSGG